MGLLWQKISVPVRFDWYSHLRRLRIWAKFRRVWKSTADGSACFIILQIVSVNVYPAWDSLWKAEKLRTWSDVCLWSEPKLQGWFGTKWLLNVFQLRWKTAEGKMALPTCPEHLPSALISTSVSHIVTGVFTNNRKKNAPDSTLGNMNF